MMSLATIKELSRKAARQAAREHLIPLMVQAEDLDHIEIYIRHIPNLGTYAPEGYVKVDEYFVDKTGLGYEDEPAMTFGAFCKRLKENGPGYGYAITEEGQFQIYVGVYQKGTLH
jgi:hypothetical protein